MTPNELAIQIKSNLGNRSSGTIGGQSIDLVILNCISTALNQILIRFNPDYYNRSATLAIVSGTKVYSLPTQDSLGNTIRVKDILSWKCYRSDGSDVSLNFHNYTEFVRKTLHYLLDETGTPSLFAIWNGKFILDKIPDEAYTFNMYVECFANQLTISDADTQLPISDEWLLAIEAYATSHAYMKLQQTQMASVWQVRYEEQIKHVPSSDRRMNSHGVNALTAPLGSSDPINDPFIRDWN